MAGYEYQLDQAPQFVRSIMSNFMLAVGMAALIGAVAGSAATLFTLWVAFNVGN